MLPGEKALGQTADVGLLGRDAVVHITSISGLITYTMTTANRSLIMTTTNSYGLTVTLPSVAQAAGMMFFFYAVVIDSGDNVSITDKGDDIDFTDITLNADNESCVLVSDGIHWFAFDGTVPAAIT